MKKYLLYILILSLACSCPKNKKGPIVIDPAGGTYDLGNGISLVVPAGAVNSKTPFSIELTDVTAAAEVLSPLGVQDSDIIRSINALPSGLKFNSPVKLVFKNIHLKEGTIPFMHQVDYESNKYFMPQTTLEYDPQKGTLSVLLYHFTDDVVQIFDNLKSYECLKEPCRCGKIRVTQPESECSIGDCQISESDTKVEFLDCGIVEESLVREVSPQCVPSLSLTADKNVIAREESTGLSAKVMLGCKPIEKQSVDFSHDALVTLSPSYDETDKDGYARTIITAGDNEGLSTITARATMSYYGIEIVSNGQEFNGPMITKQLQNQIDIFIYDNVAVYRVDLSISAQNAQSYVVCAPPLPPTFDEFYRTTLNYTANCSFEVSLPIDDINKMDISGIRGSGIQSLEILNVKPTSYIDTAINYGFFSPDSIHVYIKCIEANANNIQSPKNFDFMTVIASADNKTKQGEFCLISPKMKPVFDLLYPNINYYHTNPFENMSIIDIALKAGDLLNLDVKDISFSYWNIHSVNNVTSDAGLNTTFENNTDENINGFSKLDQPKLSAMFEPPAQFQLKFEDGYTDNGYCYIGIFSPVNYQLRVTKLR